MYVNPGELDKKIKIVSTTSTKDEDGFPINTENIIHEPWAKVTKTSGTELIKADAEFTDVKTRFLIRYTPKTLNEDMQIKYKGKYYDIVYLNDYEDTHEYIEILTDKKELV